LKEKVKLDKSKFKPKLPTKNKLLPKDFDLLKGKGEKEPIELKKWADTTLWYKKDDKFKIPKAVITA